MYDIIVISRIGGKMVKVAINGFGRIGRNALKILLDRHDVQVVLIIIDFYRIKVFGKMEIIIIVFQLLVKM